MFKYPMPKNTRYLLIAILAAVFVLPGGLIYKQSVSAAGSACGVSGEGLCQSSCGPYDDIISVSASSGYGSYCDKNEQCCVPSKCGYNNEGIGECKNVSNCGELIGKNTSDCTPPKLCCITPKIPELTCPGGVCSEYDGSLDDTDSIDATNNESDPKYAECIAGANPADCIPGQDSNASEWEGLVPCKGFDCTLCSAFELIKRIIDWLVGFILAIAVGFIVWAGILMMFSGGNSGKVTKAKEMLTTAIYGVAIALGGWLIIGTLLGVLTGSDKIMPWNKITCKSEQMKLGGEVPQLSANCSSAGGTCRDITKDTATNKCVGDYVTGLCAGSDNIKCCVPKTVSKTEPTCEGSCVSLCAGDNKLSGYCSTGTCCRKQTKCSTIQNATCVSIADCPAPKIKAGSCGSVEQVCCEAQGGLPGKFNEP